MGVIFTMLSKFIILALTEESLAVKQRASILQTETSDSEDSGYSSGDSPDVGKTGAGKKKQIAWSCKRNECRSAGAMIISTVITECFDKYKGQFDLSSFGAEEGVEIYYDQGATPTLVQAFQNNFKEYLDLIEKLVGYIPTAAEKKCFVDKIKIESKSFRSTAPEKDKICKEHMTVYAANSGVVELIEKKTKKKCVEKQIPQKIDVMKEGGIADGPWHANAMFERLALIKLLK